MYNSIYVPYETCKTAHAAQRYMNHTHSHNTIQFNTIRNVLANDNIFLQQDLCSRIILFFVFSHFSSFFFFSSSPVPNCNQKHCVCRSLIVEPDGYGNHFFSSQFTFCECVFVVTTFICPLDNAFRYFHTHANAFHGLIQFSNLSNI